MKTTTFALLLLIGLMSSLFAEPAPITAAIFDFETSGDALSGRGKEVAILLNANLSSADHVFLVEREELAKLLGEQELGRSGLVSPETSAKIGNLTGAKVLITGRLFQNAGKYFMVAKVMSAETGRVYGEVTTFKGMDELDVAAGKLAEQLTALIGKNGKSLVAVTESPMDQIERLKASLAGASLPSVSVSVEEQHLQRPIIDPAVEMELKRSLQMLGFRIVDPKAGGERADIEVTGEAFSELAGRKGNLIFCRARVELTVKSSSSDAPIVVDFQTDAGVDLAEHVAGKIALENAARKLLERIVPKMIER